MDPKIIAEVWQAFSTLSDAQEFLTMEFAHSSRMDAANDRINHAKRHLQGFIEWAEQNHGDAFVEAIQSSITCTLEGVETHDGGEGE